VGAALVSIVLQNRGGGGAPAPGPAQKPPTATAPKPAPQLPGEGLAVGIGEMDASLLWSRAAQPELRAASGHGATGLPLKRYYRLLVDWSAPDESRAGLGDARDRLPARAAAVRAVRGDPRHAARDRVSAEGPGSSRSSRSPACRRGRRRSRRMRARRRDAAVAADQRSRPRRLSALIRSLAELATSEGVALPYWSPWNEPNGTFFVSPQRATCDRSSPPVSPRVYTRLARAMRAELDVLPGVQHLVIAELAGLPRPRLRGAGVEEFYAGLPDDVICSAAVFAQHAYAERGRPETTRRPVEQLEAALDKHPCAADKPIWVTETGVGGPDVGGPRKGGLASLRRDCRALDAALRRWDARPARRGRLPVHVPRRPRLPGRPR
jgi:hypothetical protein